MSDAPVPSWLVELVEEPVLEAVQLRGSLPVEVGDDPPVDGQAWLARSARSAWVIARQGHRGRTVPLDHLELRYVVRLRGDLLRLGAYELGVPLGSAEQVQGLIGRARLSAALDCDQAPAPDRPPLWGKPVHGLAAGLLDCLLQPGEVLLAWLPTRSTAPLLDPRIPDQEVNWAWLLTTHRSMLLALGPLGELERVELPRHRALVDGSGHIFVGDHRWRVGKELLPAARRLAALTGMQPEERRREAARRLVVDGRGTDALPLLQDLPEHPLDPLCRAVAAGAVLPLSDALKTQLAALPSHDLDPRLLVAWVKSWAVPLPFAWAVEQHLRQADSLMALPLHQVLHDLEAAHRPASRVDAQADLALALHHVEVGRPGEVEPLLADHLAALPPDDLAHQLPPQAPDPLSGQGGSPLAGPMLSALATARHLRGLPTADLRCRLAQRQPLELDPLDRLLDVASGDLADRAQRSRATLAGRLQRPIQPPSSPVQPLDADQLERLRHPTSRQDGALARMPGALARMQPPDSGALRDYCERLDPGRHPQAAAALAEAATLLGLPPVPAFVSRGQRSVGLRAYEKPEPFLLLGGDHLDPDSGFFLGPAELRFAVGAELTHLRFGHRRVGADELWAGLWDKGSSALSAAAGLLPLIDLMRLSGRAVKLGVAGASALGALRSVGGQLGLGGDGGDGGPAADMSVDPARLLGMARVLDLTADRAGLLLCGDPQAAVGAIFHLHTRFRAELEIVREQGLHAALHRQDPDGVPHLPHLALRIGALMAFWLDDEHQALARATRRAAVGA